MALCLRAWKDLCTERDVSMGTLGPVKESAARAWAKEQGLDRESYRVLWAVICRLDRDFFERTRSAAELRAAKNKGGK